MSWAAQALLPFPSFAATSATSAPELATLAACQNLNPGDAAIPPSHILHQSNGPRAP